MPLVDHSRSIVTWYAQEGGPPGEERHTPHHGDLRPRVLMHHRGSSTDVLKWSNELTST